VNEIVLSDHDDPTRQYVLRGDNTWLKKRLWPWSDKVSGISGFAGVIPVRAVIYPSLEQVAGKTLLALYAHDNRLRFRLGNHSWDVTQPAVRTELSKAVASARFELVSEEGPLVGIEYDPRAIWSSEDFLEYVSTMLADASRRGELMSRWNASGKRT
jgi:hypothetical protein